MSEPTETAASAPARLPLGVLIAYGLPSVTLGFSSGLMLLYLLKFATDVMLIPPAVFASAYAMARVWDAVSDPVAGFLSDRTTHSSGRRRPWIAIGAIPMAIAVVMLWSPPASLEGEAAMLWFGLCVFFFYTAYTAVAVPHLALGAEMTTDYHDRSRVFGSRGIFDYLGVLLGGVAIALFMRSDDVRATASTIAWLFAAISIPAIWWGVARIRENPDYLSRGAHAPVKAFRDVAKNHYARLLITVFFVEEMSLAFIAAMFPYITEYIVPEQSDGTGIYLVIALCVAVASFPMWFPISRRLGKRNTWLVTNVMKLMAFYMIFLVGPDRIWPGFVAIVLIGPALAGHTILAPSVKADVVDYDEYVNHERKEGSYFAVWNLARKLAGAAAIALCGWLLQAAGYQPNVDQTEDAAFAMRLMFTGIPAVCHVIAIVLLLRFDLDQERHREIRAEIDARATASG